MSAGTGAKAASLQGLIDSGARFGAILADPPWPFRVYSGRGKRRSVERHYPTMSHADIRTGRFGPAGGPGPVEIAALALPHCALFLWAVLPQLPEALAVIEAWGFEYKTAAFCWVKTNRGVGGPATGMGYWTRSNAELVLLATRGAPRRLARDVPQIVMAPRGAHSAKPSIVHDSIERLVPGPYLELFARRMAPRWTVWGNGIEPSLFDGSIDEAAA